MTSRFSLVTWDPQTSEEKKPSLIQRGMQYLEPKPGEGPVTRFAKGAGRTTLGAAGGLVDAAIRPPDISKGEIPGGDMASTAVRIGKRLFVDPSITANQHIEDLAAEHGTKGTIPYYGGKVMADIPVLGPWGLQAGERAGKGDVAGALGETAGIALGPKATELTARGVRVAIPPIVRGVGKTYNAAHTAGQVVAPVAGIAEGAFRLSQGDLPGAAYGAAGGGFAGRAIKMLPRAPESVTKFRLPKPPVYPGAHLPEDPGTFPGAHLPEAPPPEAIQARGLQIGGRAPAEPAAGLRGIRVAPPESPPPPSIVRTPGQVAPEMIRPRAVSPYAPEEPIPARRGLMLPGEVEKRPAPEHPPVTPRGIARPVTENPAVGNLVRAMDKSGVPIAERPNLLLKGSGRVNRVLGPDEDLTDVLAKSARQARRQRER